MIVNNKKVTSKFSVPRKKLELEKNENKTCLNLDSISNFT